MSVSSHDCTWANLGESISRQRSGANRPARLAGAGVGPCRHQNALWTENGLNLRFDTTKRVVADVAPA